MAKQIAFPSITRSEKNGGFHKMFKDECKKFQYSALRVQTVTSPYLPTEAFRRGYAEINWNK